MSDEGDAAIVKSATLTVTVVVWVSPGEVPWTTTAYVPPVPVQVSMLVPEPPFMFVELSEQASPLTGEIAVERVTLPTNPLIGATVTIVEIGTPGVVLTIDGLANIEKSVNLNVTLVELVMVPFVPVTVTV